MSRHLLDLDDAALSAAGAALGTAAPEDTINEALRLVAEERHRRVAFALDVLANADLINRADTWR